MGYRVFAEKDATDDNVRDVNALLVKDQIVECAIIEDGWEYERVDLPKELAEGMDDMSEEEIAAAWEKLPGTLFHVYTRYEEEGRLAILFDRAEPESPEEREYLKIVLSPETTADMEERARKRSLNEKSVRERLLAELESNGEVTLAPCEFDSEDEEEFLIEEIVIFDLLKDGLVDHVEGSPEEGEGSRWRLLSR